MFSLMTNFCCFTGLSKTEIALISSAAVLALVIVFAAVVHFKFGVCGRKSAVAEPSDGIKFSELSATSPDTVRNESAVQSV